jgi:hypothetical protein
MRGTDLPSNHIKRPLLQAALTLAACIACLAGLITAAHAQAVGDLLVAPTRIVFDQKTRTAEISLVNIGTDTATYRVSLIRRRMTEEGRFEDVDKPLPEEKFADTLVRFTPAQVQLKPRETQMVRLQLRKPADLANGEYRAHLTFRAIPTSDVTGQLPNDDPQGIGILLTPIYGLSVPVIVRQGDLSAEVTISDMKLDPPPEGSPAAGILSVRLNRTGTCSTYADLTATFIPTAEPTKEVVVSRVLGLAVYTPNASRTVTMALQLPEGMQLAAGTLKIVYRQKEDDGGKVIAEATMPVP